MKEFFAENWKFIIYLAVAILGIVITILKKSKLVNKIVDTPFERVLALLPGLIVEAEKTGGTGSDKSNFVISRALAIYQKLVEHELSYGELVEYNHRFTDALEKILETPQKKGIVYDEKKEN